VGKAVEPTGAQAKPQTPGAGANPPSQSNQPAQQASQASAAVAQEAEPIADAVVEAEPEVPATPGEDPEEQEDAQISKKRTRDEFEAQNQDEAVAQEIIQS
tara:strand:- start:290 stop:592 length:303 start_codon:yes stop_codon:yes gene_type:complete